MMSGSRSTASAAADEAAPRPTKLEALDIHWQVTGDSVRGPFHHREGLPNQDALRLPAAGEPTIVCVSDGHGSPSSFRSATGARLAVAIAAEVVDEFLDINRPTFESLRAILPEARERLPRELVHRWQQAVNDNLIEHPFTVEERQSLEHAARPGSWQRVEGHPLLAYGATLLCVAVCRDFALYLQLGDGDILSVDEELCVDRPLQRDERLIANETTSLCSPEAWHEVQLELRPFAGVPPALILLATDGYSNSFPHEDGFRKVGSDFACRIREDGFAAVGNQLHGWLEQTTRTGSGDDITVALISRLDSQVPAVAEPEPTDPEPEPEAFAAVERPQLLSEVSSQPSTDPDDSGGERQQDSKSEEGEIGAQPMSLDASLEIAEADRPAAEPHELLEPQAEGSAVSGSDSESDLTRRTRQLESDVRTLMWVCVLTLVIALASLLVTALIFQSSGRAGDGSGRSRSHAMVSFIPQGAT